MENSIYIKQCEKVEQFWRKYSDIEADRYLVNVYLMKGEDLEQQIGVISQYFEEKNQGILNLFIEEESECKKNIMKRKGFLEVLEQYVRCRDAGELLIGRIKSISKDPIEAKTIQYLFSKYTEGAVLVDTKDIAFDSLDNIIKQVCDKPKRYAYSRETGGEDRFKRGNLQTKILCYKARFDYVWFYYVSQRERVMTRYEIEEIKDTYRYFNVKESNYNHI